MTGTKKNISKGLSYTFALKQMNRAHEKGFFLEVVTIAESIINDRVCSVVHGRRPAYLRDPERATLGILLHGWQPIDGGEAKLRELVLRWTKLRNRALHGLCKSVPGQPTEPVAEFVENSRKCAEEGISLVHSILSWHRKSLQVHLAKANSRAAK